VLPLRVFYSIVLSLCLLTACGGGASSGVAAADAQALPNAASNSSTGTGTSAGNSTGSSVDSANFVQFWNDNAASAFKNTGQFTAFFYKELPTSKLDSSVLSIDKNSGKTTLKIRQDNHGSANGDLVSISNLQLPLHGIDPKNINTTHTITLIDIHYFAISVLGVATSTAQESFNAKLSYKILDCYGSQVIEKSSLEKTLQFNEGLPLIKTKTVVSTTLNNCSPPTSQFTTYRYYTQNNYCLSNGFCGTNYELVRQEIVGGLYAFPQDWFINLVPNGSLKSGDKGDLGVLLNYNDSARTDKQGKTVLSYEVLPDTCCSVVMVLNSKTFDANGALIVEVKDFYGKAASTTGLPYSLIKTVANYNNPLKNEVVVVYSGS
jgi:hypothetical protein